MTSSDLRAIVDRNLDAVTAKDARAVLAGFADDAVLIDPHYPDAEMRGKAAISAGLRWGFAGMRTFDFGSRRYFYSPDAAAVVVESQCHHVLSGGRRLDFPQVFVVETRDGLITRWQAYEPYGPGGVGGVFLGIGKAVYRARRWARRTLRR